MHDRLFILETLPDPHRKKLLPPFKTYYLKLRFSRIHKHKHKHKQTETMQRASLNA
jgi:hypothetical protein